MERIGNDNKLVNYLDIAVNIYSHKVTTKMYNKVDDFNFEVVSFTFPHSNISINIGYNLLYSQLIRYYKICSEVQDFIHNSRKLYRELSLRGYSHWGLVRKFHLFIKNNSEIINKYNINDVTEIQRSIFNDCGV